MKRRTALTGLAILTLSAVVGSGTYAQKGGGGSTPPGTIYYSDYALLKNPYVGWYDSFVGNYSMKADGSNKLLSPYFAQGAEPSRQVHGTRWIVVSEFSADTSPYYPNGFRRAELTATREDTGAKVTLTGDPHIQDYGWGLRWAFDDSFISFSAILWTYMGASGGNYVDAGGSHWLAEAKVFRAAVDWSSGAPVAAAPVAMLGAGLYFETTQAAIDFYVRPDVVNLDWSPSGTQIAFEQITQDSPGGREYHNLRITTIASGATVQLGIGYGPEWGPLGSRVAFSTNVSATSSNMAICTVNPDGSGRLQVTGGYDFSPKWSPDQAQIAFTRSKQSNQGGLTHWLKDVMRVAATGGTPTNLTGDLSDNAYSAAWR